MMPGYLHLDATGGLTAPLLNAAMADLLGDTSCISKVLETLGLDELLVKVIEDASSVRGKSVRFFCQGQALDELDLDKLNLSHSFIKACLESEAVSLEACFEPFYDKRLDPRVSAVALRMLEQLKSPLFVEHTLAGADALWLFCHTLMLAVQLRALDPKFVSATPLHYGTANIRDASRNVGLNDHVWILQIACGLPFVEVEGKLPLDVLALAFIKSVSSLFGPRGAVTMMRLGIGLSKTCSPTTPLLASWCEASIPDTISELGFSNKAKYCTLFEVSGIVPAGHDMQSIVNMLSLHRATAVTFHLVHGEKNVDAHLVRFLIKYEHKRDALEAFLIKAAATKVTLHAVESHELNKRMVLVPLGHGNKSSSARFNEYIYYDKCVRVEPWKEDLEAYVKKTAYSVEVARADLLMAWKKWRGKLVEESHD